MVGGDRVPSLDGFRAISIALVFCSHIAIHRSTFPDAKEILAQFGFGDLGVRIFFVISGFLITFLLLKERESTDRIDMKAFYIRRILRIFPVFYSYLAVLIVLNLMLSLDIPWLTFLSAGLYIQNFLPWGSNWYIQHSWSLAVEEQFYILWPLIFLMVKNLKDPRVFIGSLIIGSLMRAFYYKYPETSVYFLAPFFRHADFLFSGCFVAFLLFYQYDRVLSFVKNVKPVFVYVAVFCLWLFSKFEFHPVYDKIFIPLSGPAINVSICFLLVYFIIRKETTGYKILNFPAVVFVGQLSYSLYLWQQFFLSSSTLWICNFPQNVVFAFLVAVTSFYVIEKPFLKLKKKFQPTRPA